MPFLRSLLQPGKRNVSSLVVARLFLLLAQQLSQLQSKPPVTIVLVLVNVVLFLQPYTLSFLPPVHMACLQPYKILEGLELGRLLTSAFLHVSEAHVFYNCTSLIWKGAQLEPALGSMRFLRLVGELLLTTQALAVLLARAGAAAAPALLGPQYYDACAVGFSGVLFALKVVLSARTPGWSTLAGVRLPTKYVCWAELAYVQLVTPRASLLCHIAGILAGLLHVTVTGVRMRWPRPVLGVFRGRANLAGPRTPTGGEAHGMQWEGGMSGWEDLDGGGGCAGNARKKEAGGGDPRLAAAAAAEARRAAGEQPRRGWRGAAAARRAASLPLRDMRPPLPPRGASPDGWSSEGSRGGSPRPDGACGGTWDAWDAGAAPRQRRRRRGVAGALSWRRAAAVGAGAALLCSTRPDGEHFVRFVHEYTQRGLGFIPGFAVASVVWLQRRTGLGFQLWNCGLFTVARYAQRYWFVGVLNTWLPVPVNWMATLATHSRSLCKDGRMEAPPPLEALVALNAAVFLAWLALPRRWMARNFEVAAGALGRRPWTAAAATVSHANLFDLTGNMQMLLLVGPALQAELGGLGFLLLYIAGGMLANLAAYVWNSSIKRRRRWTFQGASASIYALLACNAVVDPYRKFVWLFGLELNSLGLLGAKLLYEWTARRLGAGGIQTLATEVVGALTGFAFAALYLDADLLSRLPKTIVP
ncbi:hypothetical protein WJX81_004112 [Elliptochloris bilobata]|uniref:Peptidase S54 rhomboid domain-containing protein n=1 Tax=Elliptochloris bilobata TaxID=381761 RepID=A0AAW1QA76_9CHLO